MALMAHQNTLMLLFFLPQTSEMIDLSHILERDRREPEAERSEADGSHRKTEHL